jgi:polar amino acid transport system substrate-binding protein
MATELEALFNSQTIQTVLDRFFTLTGISAAVINLDGSLLFSSTRPPLCSNYYDARPGNLNSCRLSRALLQNREITADHQVTRLCPYGLLDAIEPLIIEGKRIGAVLIGQVFTMSHFWVQALMDSFRNLLKWRNFKL